MRTEDALLPVAGEAAIVHHASLVPRASFHNQAVAVNASAATSVAGPRGIPSTQAEPNALIMQLARLLAVQGRGLSDMRRRGRGLADAWFPLVLAIIVSLVAAAMLVAGHLGREH